MTMQMIFLVASLQFLPKTLLTRDRNPLLFVSFSCLTCQRNYKNDFQLIWCTITESNINHLIFLYTLENKKEIKKSKNTNHFMLTFFGLEVAPQQNSRTNQDVRCSLCQQRLKRISNMFLTKWNLSMHKSKCSSRYYVTFC